MKLTPIYYIIMALAIASCKPELPYDDFMDYINFEDNGLSQHQLINGVRIELCYWPKQLVAWQSIRNIDTLSTTTWNDKCKHYQQYHYLRLQLSTGSGELLHAYVQNQRKYSQLVNELSFGMASKAYLIEQPCDTLAFIDSYMPRFYGANAATEIMLIYSNENAVQHDLRFELKDLGLGTGDVQFVFRKEHLNNIPDLSIQNKLNKEKPNL